MPKRPSGPMPLAQVQTWMRAHKMTLRGLARGMGRSPSLVSKVMRGKVQSDAIWRELRAYMADPKDYPRRVAAQVGRARAVLRRAGLLS